MRIRPLPLLIAVTVLALAAFYLLAGKPSDPAATAADASAAAIPAEENGPGDDSIAITPGPDGSAFQPGVAADPLARETERESLLPSADEMVLSGRVTLPDGTPSDEELHVVALRQSLDVRRLGGGTLFAPIWGGSARSGARPDDGTDAADSPGTELILAHTRVAADGEFSLLLPEGTKRAHLALTGRYLYSDHTTLFEASQEDIVLTPHLGAWISGEVVAAEDAGALETDDLRVGLFPDITSGRFNPMRMGQDFTSARTLTDGEGAFAFRGVPAAATFGLVARTAKQAVPVELGLKPQPGEHIQVRMEAGPGATLRGRIVDDMGHGVPEASVSATLPGILGQIIEEVRSTETDEEGNFVLEGLPEGPLKLKYSTPGFLDGSLTIDSLTAGQVQEGIELSLERGASCRGRVTFPDGQPAPGALITLSLDASAMAGMPGMGASAFQGGVGETDAEGRFSIGGLRGGPFLVQAILEVEDGPRVGDWSARATKVKLSRGEIDLVLEKLEEFRVRVTDSAGVPLEEYRLRATLKGTSGMFGIGAKIVSHSVEQAEDGQGILAGLDTGEWELVISADGYADSEVIPFSIPAPDEAHECVLFPDAAARGLVLDSDGRPVAGAEVTISLDMQDLISGATNPPTATTDAVGAFLLDGINPGPVALVASAQGYARSEPFTFDLEPGAMEEDVVLVLPSGGTILGQVVDEEGNPRPDRMIVAQKPPDYTGQRMDRTDQDGRFVLEHLEPGRWQITAMKNMLGSDEPGADSEEGMASLLEGMEVEFVEVAEGETVELVLGASSEFAVSVKVHVLANGEPVSGAMVSFVPEDPGDSKDSAAGPNMNFKVTDSEGWAQLEVEHAGPYLVSVQQNMAMGRQSVVEYIQVIPEEEEHQIEIELPVGSIKGRIFSPKGEPLAGCRVTLTVADGMNFGSFLGGNYAEVVTDDEGDYSIENLRPGTYSVAAGGSLLGGLFGSDAPGGRVVRGDLKITAGRVIEGVDFHLEEPGTITGIVRDTNGLPVEGAAVFVRDSSGLLLERFSFVASASDGSFRYTGVQAGTYFVSARKTGLASHESAPVRVASGKEAEVSLRLEAGTMLLVRVIDRSGKDVQSRVRVVDPNGHEVTGMLSMQDIMENFGSGFSSSVQRVGPLAPGSYRVEVTAEDGRSSSKSVTLDGRAERKLTVRLR